MIQRRFLMLWLALAPVLAWASPPPQDPLARRPNVLFLISDDLTATALSCYGSEVCQTPNIDRLAARGTRFTRAYCQGTYCGPSRASFLSGYYPHALPMLGYKSPRPLIGDRATWPEHFKDAGYWTGRVSKIFHMGVPGGIEEGTHGADDERSWNFRVNCQGPEWRAPGEGETLEGNPDGKKPVVGGNTFVVLAAEGGDEVHSDGKAAREARELLLSREAGTPWWLGVGFVRPHVPFVAPKEYFEAFPWRDMVLPKKHPGDQDDIPRPGINYKTSQNMQMDVERQKKAVAGYYASVVYMDAMVGRVLDALEESGALDETIVVFTSDHGYHLGEHDFWAKVSLLEESVRVPLIVAVPGKEPAVCDSFVELIDLFPTVANLCGLEVPGRLQGVDFSVLFDEPEAEVRDAAFCVNGKGALLRDERYAYIRYVSNPTRDFLPQPGKALGGEELYDMRRDPQQVTNLAGKKRHAKTLEDYRERLTAKFGQVYSSDLAQGAWGER